MSTVTINNSPLHIDATLTAVYGEQGSYWSNFHTGTDFVPYGLGAPTNPDLFSVCSGVVENVINTPTSALGNQIVIKDNSTGNYWRYCHMKDSSPLSIGDTVDTFTKVGNLGATGNVTGPHLHLEYSSVPYWDNTYTYFLNPSDALGIPNVRGTIVKFDGTPPPPTPTEREKGFKWWIFTKSIKQRRNLTKLN